MRIKYRYIWLALTAIAIAIFTFFILPNSAKDEFITSDNYERVEVGMTLAQVENILNQPRSSGLFPGDVCSWDGNNASIFVWFDTTGHVSNKKFSPNPPPSMIRLILKKLGF